MRRLLLPLLLAAAVAGCPVGPGYHRPPVDTPNDWRPPSPLEDTLRPFYDSIAAHPDTLPAAARDSTMPLADSMVKLMPPSPSADTATATSIDWFALLQDTVLRRLVDTAIAENRTVRAAIATIDEFRAEYGVAKGPLFPQITANGSAGKERIAFGGVPITFDVYQVTGNVSWELDFWGRLRRSTQAAREDLVASEESRRAVVLSLISDVATAYLELRELDLDLDISRRTLESRRETLRLAQRRFQHGLISELDVRQFESQVADPAARVADFQRQIVQKEDQLSILLGHHPANVPRGEPLPAVLASIVVPRALPSSLLERRPDVRQAEAQLRAATARIGVAEAARLPTVTITGDYGTQSTTASGLFKNNSDVYSILGGVSVPIFSGGQYSNEVKAARARADQARYMYQQTVLTALQDAQDALIGLRASHDQLIAQQMQVTSLQSALHLATRRYDNGISSYLDVLDAQRSLFTAELSLAQVQRQELVSAVQLYKALGGGWPSDSTSGPGGGGAPGSPR